MGSTFIGWSVKLIKIMSPFWVWTCNNKEEEFIRYLVARRPPTPSPFLLVETPRKFPGGFTSPTRADKLGARGILRDGDRESGRVRTDGTRLGVPGYSDEGLLPSVITSRSSLAAAAAAESLSSSWKSLIKNSYNDHLFITTICL